MADVPTIFRAIQTLLAQGDSWKGISVLVTAGPTQEPLDPVRYLTNRSSGKMGYAIAEAARSRGASVTLVTGPTALPVPGGMTVIRVETAAQMGDAVLSHAEESQYLIAAAAVADFRPAQTASHKIKKSSLLVAGGNEISLVLEPTDDILAELGRRKHPGQTLIGFAAETQNIRQHAQDKLRAKNLDWIIANDVTAEGAGFEGDTNIVTMLSAIGQEIALPLLTKREVAEQILDTIRPAAI